MRRAPHSPSGLASLRAAAHLNAPQDVAPHQPFIDPFPMSRRDAQHRVASPRNATRQPFILSIFLVAARHIAAQRRVTPFSVPPRYAARRSASHCIATRHPFICEFSIHRVAACRVAPQRCAPRRSAMHPPFIEKFRSPQRSATSRPASLRRAALRPGHSFVDFHPRSASLRNARRSRASLGIAARLPATRQPNPRHQISGASFRAATQGPSRLRITSRQPQPIRRNP